MTIRKTHPTVFFRERDALGIFHQIIGAVTYLHERDIAHRNLNIHNILYNRQTFQIKISNFLCAVQTTNNSLPSKGIISKSTLYKLKWGASSLWSSSLSCRMRNSDQMAIGKTHPTLCLINYESQGLILI